RIVNLFVKYYNDERLHSAIGYVIPKDKLMGNESKIFAEHKRKLKAAREQRAKNQRTTTVAASSSGGSFVR
ncbi:MAG: transposase, partial [Chloroflexi bacterium]|nr:transposase [Chloroflexota bacterium]